MWPFALPDLAPVANCNNKIAIWGLQIKNY